MAQEEDTAFQVEAFAIELIEALQPLVPRIKARDRALADQVMRAASSVALNIGEANYSDPGNRRAPCTLAPFNVANCFIASRLDFFPVSETKVKHKNGVRRLEQDRPIWDYQITRQALTES
jgi:hypothetical protein